MVWVNFITTSLFSRTLESWLGFGTSSPNSRKFQVSEILWFTQNGLLLFFLNLQSQSGEFSMAASTGGFKTAIGVATRWLCRDCWCFGAVAMGFFGLNILNPSNKMGMATNTWVQEWGSGHRGKWDRGLEGIYIYIIIIMHTYIYIYIDTILSSYFFFVGYKIDYIRDYACIYGFPSSKRGWNLRKVKFHGDISITPINGGCTH